MPEKTHLTERQEREIRALRGKKPVAEIKKKFGIGTDRLYRIWGEGVTASHRGGRVTASHRDMEKKAKYLEGELAGLLKAVRSAEKYDKIADKQR